jgi:glycosyltransferase involved in cell wall biosynthesis
MRRSDRRSAQEVARYLAPGPFVAEQIKAFYGRDAEVVGAPVDCSLFRPSAAAPGDFWLFCGRLIEPYKKVTILVEAFNRVGERLVIAGDGPERERLQQLAGPNVEFRGMLADDELVPLMQTCKAAIFPSQDDFGLIPVEVNACGRPVLAFAGGGALGTVAAGVSGELFPSQTADAIVSAVRQFRPGSYDTDAIRSHALQWDAPRFRERITAAVLDEAERARERSGRAGRDKPER